MFRRIRYGAFALFTETTRFEDAVGGEKWLDEDLVLTLGQPMILAIPTGDHSYYLSIRAYQRDSRRMEAGVVGNKITGFSLGGVDPVCGKKVGRGAGYDLKKKAAASLEFQGNSIFFCSEACLEKYQQNPGKYLPEKTRKRSNSSRSDKERSAPARPIILIYPEYPEVCRKDKIEGTVEVDLSMGENGMIRNASILSSPHPELEKSSKETLRQWICEPARREEKPEAAVLPVKMEFMLGQRESPAVQSPQADQSKELDQVLMKAADYCDRLESAALNFICEEKIRESIYSSSSPAGRFVHMTVRRGERENYKHSSQSSWPEDNTYVHDYQLIRKDGRIDERRILIWENGEMRHTVYPPVKTIRFYVNKPVFGPIDLLGRKSQPNFRYAKLKEEHLDGRTAWLIEADLQKPIPGRPNFGKAWVDPADGSILKMEVANESLMGYETIQADYESRGIVCDYSLVLFYGVEKNGLRYPSRIVFNESYSDAREGKYKVSGLEITYDKYKYFSVEAEEKIKKQ